MTQGVRYPHTSKTYSLIAILAVYVAAVLLAFEVACYWVSSRGLTFILVADIIATLIVYVFSHWYRNASTYDAYWSVIPMLIVAWWLVNASASDGVETRQWLVVALVWLWGARLTWNWVLRWRGLADEDWRFSQLQQRHGQYYWLVNLGGIHLLPTLLVFLGCVAAFPAISDSGRALNFLDLLAFLVTLAAITLEAVADWQLWRHRQTASGEILNTGLWACCRHPNYLGEVMFWWGVYLFGLAADPSWWWSGIGALSITGLFVWISIPMMDKYMLERYSQYDGRLRRIPALVPVLFRRRQA